MHPQSHSPSQTSAIEHTTFQEWLTEETSNALAAPNQRNHESQGQINGHNEYKQRLNIQDRNKFDKT